MCVFVCVPVTPTSTPNPTVSTKPVTPDLAIGRYHTLNQWGKDGN